MKKKILGGLLVVAIAAVAAFNVSMNTQESELSLLALANVEALASREEAGITCGSGGIGSCYVLYIREAYFGQCWRSCNATGNPSDSCNKYLNGLFNFCEAFIESH